MIKTTTEHSAKKYCVEPLDQELLVIVPDLTDLIRAMVVRMST